MAREFDRQVAGLQVRAAILNRFTQLGTPTTNCSSDHAVILPEFVELQPPPAYAIKLRYVQCPELDQVQWDTIPYARSWHPVPKFLRLEIGCSGGFC